MAGCLLAVLLAGCATSATPHALGASRASSVQGLPVPQQAQVVAQVGRHVVSYILPLGISLGALDQWYRIKLVPGRPWRGWTWCAPARHGGRTEGTRRDWDRGEASLSLSTSAVDDQDRIYVDQGGTRLACR